MFVGRLQPGERQGAAWGPLVVGQPSFAPFQRPLASVLPPSDTLPKKAASRHDYLDGPGQQGTATPNSETQPGAVLVSDLTACGSDGAALRRAYPCIVSVVPGTTLMRA